MIFKSYYKHYKNYKTFDNTYIIIIKCIVLGILGFILGIIINNFVVYFSNIFKIKNNLLQNITQITFCSIIVSLLHTSNNFIGWTLHNTIPGIFFITLLFNAQFKLIHNLESNYILYNDNDNDN